jgi:hypothetical protein
VAFACPDHELAPAAVGDLAGDRIVEEAVLQAIDDERLEPVKGLADLPVFGALERLVGLWFNHCAVIPSCL